MNVVVTVFILILSAQRESLSENDLPYAIQLKNGESIHAFVEDDQWKKTRMRVELDAPWLDPQYRRETIWSRDIDVEDTYRENAGERNRRIVRGYEAVGFVFLETEGDGRWIHKSEIALADRAFELEGLVLEKRLAKDSDAEAEIIGEALVERERAPFLELWGMHVALAAGLLVLGGLVSWGLIFR